MYAKCGVLAKAKDLFDTHKSRDVVTWTALIVGYTQNGQSEDALHHFEQMQHEGLSPDAVTYSCILKACGSMEALDKGVKIHNAILKQGLLKTNIVLANALISMYVKCGALAKAQEVLQGLPCRDVISWTTLIAGYADLGKSDKALKCYEDMQQEGLSPNTVTFIHILKACGIVGELDKVERFHDEAAKRGLLKDNVVLTTVFVDMYAKCGAFTKAWLVLQELPLRDVSVWTALISGYVEHGDAIGAFNCFEQMQSESLCPDGVTFACLLKACGSIKAIEKGERLHHEIVKHGLLGSDLVLGNALLDMYAKCGALTKAEEVLEELPSRDATSWNALLAGYVLHGEGEQALYAFECMQKEGHSPDTITFACTLKACGSIGAADRGKEIHEEVMKRGLLGNNAMLCTALVDMYCKCGAPTKAQAVLEEDCMRNVMSWTALVAGFADSGENEQALKCFNCMQSEGVIPNGATFVCVLRVCGAIGAVDKGETIYDELAKQGMLENDVVLANALLDMYAKCGALAKAQRVLEGLPMRDVVSWTALIGGYVDHGSAEQALDCLELMQHEGLIPNTVTLVSLLKVCSNMVAAEEGERIHAEISKQGLLGTDIVLDTTLVNMYAKCCALAKARRVLDELPVRNTVSWNALIAGYAEQGDDAKALDCLEWMQGDGIPPDAATLSSVLSACSHLGLVDKAQTCLVHMSTTCGIKLAREHYTCMVDLFRRVGYLDMAVGVIEKMHSPDAAVWLALLGGCLEWGSVEVGRWAFEHAVQVRSRDEVEIWGGRTNQQSFREGYGRVHPVVHQQ